MGRRKATCKFNFKYPPDHESYKNGLLPLPLGDTVVILAETEDWFFGHTFTSSSKGLFPKAYVYYDERDIEQEPLVAETKDRILDLYQKYTWLNGIHFHVGSQGVPIELFVNAAKVFNYS